MAIKKQVLKSKPEVKVTFKAEKSLVNGASEVSLTGDFNEWDPKATKMKALKSGDFTVTINLPVGDEFSFKYLLDGSDYICEPSADKEVANEFGGVNSVVIAG